MPEASEISRRASCTGGFEADTFYAFQHAGLPNLDFVDRRCLAAYFRYSLRVGDITVILERVEKGDPRAAEELLPLVYGELRKLAAHKMAAESSSHTLQPTALVHEAWLRVAGDDGQAQFQNREIGRASCRERV